MPKYEVITKTDIASDHRLVRVTLRMNKKIIEAASHNKQKPLNIHTQKVKGVKKRFEINLKSRSEKVEEEESQKCQ